MTYKIINTGSSGNMLILSNNISNLVIDAGASTLLPTPSKTLILVTHKHTDHYCFASTYIKKGYKVVYAENKIIDIPGFVVKPLLVPHQIENYALLIKCKITGKTAIYATDLSDFHYKFDKKIDIVFIEINYITGVLYENLGKINNVRLNNKLQGHLSFEKFVERGLEALSDTFVIMHYSDIFIDKGIITEYFYKNNKTVFLGKDIIEKIFNF